MDASPAVVGLDEGRGETRPLDATAFGQGFQQTRDGIFRYLRARCQTDDEAADLTAATFERAWRSRDRFQGDSGGYTPWVYQIARRLAIDAARKPRRCTSGISRVTRRNMLLQTALSTRRDSLTTSGLATERVDHGAATRGPRRFLPTARMTNGYWTQH